MHATTATHARLHDIISNWRAGLLTDRELCTMVADAGTALTPSACAGMLDPNSGLRYPDPMPA
jgi:hypothetical protein